MSRLRSTDRVREWLLPPRCLLGRSRRCDIVLEDPVVSSEHALLRWRDGVWELQDLHSRNGTYVGGRLLAGGEKIGLDAAAEFGLGQRQANFRIDAGPPLAHAVSVESSREVVEARGGFLVLPSVDAPEVTVLHRELGCESAWQLERDDRVETITDGAVIQVGDRAWRLHLPLSLPPTEDADDTPLTVANLTLAFALDDDGELRELEIIRGHQRAPVKIRAHLRVLLALARLRRQSDGWIAQSEFTRQLDYADGRLNVEVHRIRRQFAEHGVVDAANVVERHPSEPKLRIGVAAVEFRGP